MAAERTRTDLKGRIVILSGPSGVGKDTVLEAWIQRNSNIVRVVTYTSRNPRSGEVNGVDYNFVTRERFRELAAAGFFLEWKEVHGNLYATPLADMEDILRSGQVAVLKIDVQGAIDAMALRPDALSIMLLPPSWEELERRLRDRNTDSEEVVVRRLANAQHELALAPHYQYQVVNENLEHTVDQLQKILQAQAG